MRRSIILFLLLSCLAFATVRYHFKSSQLIITGLESYDEVELEIEKNKITLPSSKLVVPWRKNYNTTLILTPIKAGVKGSRIILRIDANKDNPPQMKLKVPSYVSLGKLVMDVSVEDDWDDPRTLKYTVYVDGNKIDPPKYGKLEIDTFFLNSGERRLRIICKDSNGNTVDQTYKFIVVSTLPSSPQVNQGKIISNRVHRVYTVRDGAIEAFETRASELSDQFVFVCDLDSANNESFPALYYKDGKLVQYQNPIIMSLADSCSLQSEHAVFGKIVIPAGQMVVLRPGATLKINSNCELIVRGTLVLQQNSKVTGPGNLVVVESGKLIVNGAKIESNVFVDGATSVWLSNVNLSTANIRLTRSSLLTLKNVKAERLILENVRKLWIDSCEFENLEILNCGDATMLNSKMSQLKLSQSSKMRAYSCTFYSSNAAVSISDLSNLELVDSWVSGKVGIDVQNFSVLRVRSTQINGDLAVSANGYSVIETFASVLTGSKALQLRDSRWKLSKTQTMGEIVKFGFVEIVQR
ncbi:hypothetical protein [Pseudothermotoga sp.]|nr:hypothetical protein [Pseudothermotoga sp.]MCX7812525.1 hypothetical protein [Pseudothermotoga sp.]MDW8138806.1 hypothetical protein [Pseudothermotoga sp.]